MINKINKNDNSVSLLKVALFTTYLYKATYEFHQFVESR